MNQTVKMPALRVGAKSHVGKVRSENQDRMGRFPSPLGELYIVVDGMGGHKGGTTAAAMTIDGLVAHLKTLLPGVSPEQALQDAATRTNLEIYQKANDGDPETEGMGATLVMGLVRDRQIIVAHAGDSRVYRFRDGRLERLTRDHSVVQRMIDHNMLTEEQARDHPDASVITRAFGQKPDIELEVSSPVDLREGDGILLCSDGLCGYVDDQAIEQVIDRYTDAQQVTDSLIALALAAGGEDNVTIQFLQFGERKPSSLAARVGKELNAGATRAPNDSSLAWRIALILAGLILLSLIVLFATKVISFDGLFSSNIANSNSGAISEKQPGKGNENKQTENPSTQSAAGTNESKAQQDGGEKSEAAAGENPSTATPIPIIAVPEDVTGLTSPVRKRSIGITLHDPPAASPDPEKRFEELYSAPGRRTLVLLFDAGGLLPNKGVYFKQEFEAEARRLAEQMGGRVKAIPLPANLVGEFEDYEIIIRP